MNSKVVNIKIPTSLQEITLGQYLTFRKISEDDPDYDLKFVSILCDIDIDLVKKISLNEYNEIIAILSQTMNKTAIFRQRFKIGEKEYGFIPNLDNITLGEYIDLDKYIRNEQDLPKVMSILFREIDQDVFGKYRIKEYTAEEDTDIMLEAPYDAVQGSLVFFYHLGNELLTHIPKYLEEQSVKNTQFKQHLEKSGVGIQAYTDSLMNSLEELKKQQEQTFTKHLHF